MAETEIRPTLESANPSEIASLHLAFERTWETHGQLATIGGRRRRSNEETIDDAMGVLGRKAEQLSLSILCSEPVDMTDLVVLAVHIAEKADRLPTDKTADAATLDAIAVAAESMLVFLVRSNDLLPPGSIAKSIISMANRNFGVRMQGLLAGEEA